MVANSAYSNAMRELYVRAEKGRPSSGYVGDPVHWLNMWGNERQYRSACSYSMLPMRMVVAGMLGLIWWAVLI